MDSSSPRFNDALKWPVSVVSWHIPQFHSVLKLDQQITARDTLNGSGSIANLISIEIRIRAISHRDRAPDLRLTHPKPSTPARCAVGIRVRLFHITIRQRVGTTRSTCDARNAS